MNLSLQIALNQSAPALLSIGIHYNGTPLVFNGMPIAYNQA